MSYCDRFGLQRLTLGGGLHVHGTDTKSGNRYQQDSNAGFVPRRKIFATALAIGINRLKGRFSVIQIISSLVMCSSRPCLGMRLCNMPVTIIAASQTAIILVPTLPVVDHSVRASRSASEWPVRYEIVGQDNPAGYVRHDDQCGEV